MPPRKGLQYCTLLTQTTYDLLMHLYWRNLVIGGLCQYMTAAYWWGSRHNQHFFSCLQTWFLAHTLLLQRVICMTLQTNMYWCSTCWQKNDPHSLLQYNKIGIQCLAGVLHSASQHMASIWALRPDGMLAFWSFLC